MNWKEEWKPLAAIIAVFSAVYYLPLEWMQEQVRLPQGADEILLALLRYRAGG
jgi:uncharacterized protein